MLLAGDVGGTKALLGLFEPHQHRPTPVATEEFATLEHDHFEAILERFLKGHGVSAGQSRRHRSVSPARSPTRWPS